MANQIEIGLNSHNSFYGEDQSPSPKKGDLIAKEEFVLRLFKEQRPLMGPNWFDSVFSEECVAIRPEIAKVNHLVHEVKAFKQEYLKPAVTQLFLEKQSALLKISRARKITAAIGFTAVGLCGLFIILNLLLPFTVSVCFLCMTVAVFAYLSHRNSQMKKQKIMGDYLLAKPENFPKVEHKSLLDFKSRLEPLQRIEAEVLRAKRDFNSAQMASWERKLGNQSLRILLAEIEKCYIAIMGIEADQRNEASYETLKLRPIKLNLSNGSLIE